jgi:hypothetical protein
MMKGRRANEERERELHMMNVMFCVMNIEGMEIDFLRVEEGFLSESFGFIWTWS